MPPKTNDEIHETFAPWERNFREQMVRIRESRGMNQTDLARRLAVFGLPFHQQTIQRIESGKRPVRLNEAHLIARELDVSLDSMMVTAAPNAREMIGAVDEMRRGADRFAHNLTEDLSEWAEKTGGLTLAVQELLDTYDKTNKDPVLVYGFNWANRAYDAYAAAYNALQDLVNIVRGAEVEEPMKFDEFDVMESWWELHGELFSGAGWFPEVPSDDSAS